MPEKKQEKITVYTDGAAKGNPGRAGWGAVFILRGAEGEKVFELGGRVAHATNNQMELQAVIEGLRLLTRRSRVEIVTDSSYVAKGSKEWLPGWKRNGWKRKDGGHDFAARGNLGQFVFVSPSNDIVIVRHGTRYGLPAAEWGARTRRMADALGNRPATLRP